MLQHKPGSGPLGDANREGKKKEKKRWSCAREVKNIQEPMQYFALTIKRLEIPIRKLEPPKSTILIYTHKEGKMVR